MKLIILITDLLLLISLFYLYFLTRKELKSEKPSRDKLLIYTKYFNLLTITLAVLGIVTIVFKYIV